ncbi:hypothetical protein BUALT_Bualt04G0086200 [Buddleja alternifolia]|uniref:S-adenosylmethionine-dependent methyltransferase n=1 Tax=Buddleja alternifolia TaxID=168488 RepID=A0AAV6XNP1_9LAMI|nr:hypothetical protein BUALT_Bualt04G0086200 [Buddleja alternifolia]
MDESKLKEGSCKYHMIGGDGPNSYAQNSEYQKQLLVSAEELIHELIDKHLDLENPPFDPQNTFKIADFGCSIGPNAFFAIENIIAAIVNKYKSNQNKNPNHPIPEFQIFFNDLVDNDFNTLFTNLPTARKYFVAGVPGSFHGRLFPKSTLHFAHCSTALHWLSRVPEAVAKRGSTAWNKGKIHYSGAGEEVKEAYAGQYREDMEVFLNARGEELVDGGLMVLVLIGFRDGVLCSDSSIGGVFDILISCLQDVANMGKISEEKVDSFNLPFYYPSPSELKGLIEANGLFNIERMAELGAPMRRNPDAQVLTSHLRAVIEGLIEEQFGDGIVEELFTIYLERFAKSPALLDDRCWKETNYFVFLKRKPSFPIGESLL